MIIAKYRGQSLKFIGVWACANDQRRASLHWHDAKSNDPWQRHNKDVNDAKTLDLTTDLTTMSNICHRNCQRIVIPVCWGKSDRKCLNSTCKVRRLTRNNIKYRQCSTKHLEFTSSATKTTLCCKSRAHEIAKLHALHLRFHSRFLTTLGSRCANKFCEWAKGSQTLGPKLRRGWEILAGSLGNPPLRLSRPPTIRVHRVT